MRNSHFIYCCLDFIVRFWYYCGFRKGNAALETYITKLLLSFCVLLKHNRRISSNLHLHFKKGFCCRNACVRKWKNCHWKIIGMMKYDQSAGKCNVVAGFSLFMNTIWKSALDCACRLVILLLNCFPILMRPFHVLHSGSSRGHAICSESWLKWIFDLCIIYSSPAVA